VATLPRPLLSPLGAAGSVPVLCDSSCQTLSTGPPRDFMRAHQCTCTLPCTKPPESTSGRKCRPRPRAQGIKVVQPHAMVRATRGPPGGRLPSGRTISTCPRAFPVHAHLLQQQWSQNVSLQHPPHALRLVPSRARGRRRPSLSDVHQCTAKRRFGSSHGSRVPEPPCPCSETSAIQSAGAAQVQAIRRVSTYCQAVSQITL
jgi:hypothetical protein